MVTTTVNEDLAWSSAAAAIEIATMAANILARSFKVPMSDYNAIDISPDIHVRRTFVRLGLLPPSASNDLLIYSARAQEAVTAHASATKRSRGAHPVSP